MARSTAVSRAVEAALASWSLGPDRRLLRAVLVLGAVLWIVVLGLLVASGHNGLVDMQVYRTGGQAWLAGIPLYDVAFPAPLPGPALPFTYPPIAAVLFAGVTVLPWWAAVVAVIGTGVAGLAVACSLAADRLTTVQVTSGQVTSRRLANGRLTNGLLTNGLLTNGRLAANGFATNRFAIDRLAGQPAQAVLLAATAVASAPLLEPVRETVSFGQVNLLLLGMIAADCLLPRTPWPRGAMIGLAAAVKLTPAAFLLFFVARREWRPVLAAAGAFAAAGLAGLLLAPGDTAQYWFGALLDPSRVGGPAFTSNQSIRGALARLGLPAGVETLGWLGLSAAVAVLAMVAIGWLRRRGDDLGALLVTASAALLISPVSWSHHWVWVTLGLLWLAVAAWRQRSRATLAVTAGVFAVFVAAPHWWLPSRDGRELSWSWWQHLVGNAYVWCAMAVVIVAAAAALRERRAQCPEPGRQADTT